MSWKDVWSYGRVLICGVMPIFALRMTGTTEYLNEVPRCAGPDWIGDLQTSSQSLYCFLIYLKQVTHRKCLIKYKDTHLITLEKKSVLILPLQNFRQQQIGKPVSCTESHRKMSISSTPVQTALQRRQRCKEITTNNLLDTEKWVNYLNCDMEYYNGLAHGSYKSWS
jgi:hypothetical protein